MLNLELGELLEMMREKLTTMLLVLRKSSQSWLESHLSTNLQYLWITCQQNKANKGQKSIWDFDMMLL